MNKTELIAKVAEKASIERKESERAVAAVFEAITEALKQNDKVQIMGFGSFEVKERAAHQGRNPATGETIEIAASKAPVFKAGKSLRDAIK